MAIKEIIKHSGDGETSNVPVKREEETAYPAPYREITQWMDQWNRWFDSFFGRAFDLNWPGWDTPRALAPRLGFGTSTFWPAINMSETDNEYRLTAELPGMDEKDIELSLSKGLLTIKGEKKEETEDKGKGYYRMERSYGTFHRTIQLPDEVDAEHVTADFKKGVLTVVLPKLPESTTGTKKIEVKGEGK